ncbi:hypothetical protein WR25_08428 [Diploscapter pachys]|uniref:Uncharacterized protein n=1 Tax=Diploscapter pachys TaxID=2018661 RepID=A0A2A2KTT7_9BILA|nr:hypothetical protein WR25_08428 [Diploscapter pachys]
MLRTLISRRTAVSLCRQMTQFNRRQDRIKRFLPQALQQKCIFTPVRFLSTAQTSDTDDFKDEKDEADLQRPVPSTSLNLPADNKQLLLEIIDKLTEAGTNFIIPKNDEIIDAVCENMEELFKKVNLSPVRIRPASRGNDSAAH